jgi:DNA-binding winged helix-turn-helix (wHTH) protein
MVAERRELSSLPKPAAGYFWSPEARERRHQARTTGGKPWQPSSDGPRPDAAETKYLPTLTPGVDKLPQRCIFCRSALLDKHEAAGGEQRGTLTCTACGRQLAWLRPRITATPLDRISSVMSERAAPRATEPPRTMRPAASAAFERLEGCGPACGLRTGHHPKTHEEHGRKMAFAEVLDRPSGIVRTGPLTIDMDTLTVTVGGRVVPLRGNGYAVLAFLAMRLGRPCTYEEITEAAWDRATAEAWGKGAPGGRFGGVATMLNRLRHQLGPAGGLVETIRGYGLKLRTEPPIGGQSEPRPARRPRVRRFRLHHRLAAESGRAVRLVVVGPRSRRGSSGAIAVLICSSQAQRERERERDA